MKLKGEFLYSGSKVQPSYGDATKNDYVVLLQDSDLDTARMKCDEATYKMFQQKKLSEPVTVLCRYSQQFKSIRIESIVK